MPDANPIIAPGDYELSDGRTLHVWTGGSEDEPALWACSLNDHGPFCRLCQLVDGVLDACLINVIDGRLECRQEANGEFRFKVTEAGEDALRAMIWRASDR